MMFLVAAVGIFFLSAVLPTTASIYCGANTAITISGSSAVAPVAQAWADSYAAACGNTITVTSFPAGGSAAGAQAACNATTTPVGIGLLSRPLNPLTEAIPDKKNPFKNYCASNSDSVLIEVKVATSTLVFVAGPNGIAKQCIASLAGGTGGLTFSQIRWIYSNFSLADLQSDFNFDPAAVPNSDNNDSTHLWSELCSGTGCNCPAVEIGIAGSPISSGTFTLFADQFLPGDNETVRSEYKSGTSDGFVANQVKTLEATIGFLPLAQFNASSSTVYPISIYSSTDLAYHTPTSENYPATFSLYMEVAQSSLSKVQGFFVYAFSDAGNANVTNAGFVPINNLQAVQMLSRLGATGGVNLSNVACGNVTGPVLQGGSATVFPLAYLWGNVYGDACGLSFTTIAGSSTLGAQLACGVPDPTYQKLAAIGLLSRPFQTTEAALSANPSNAFDYKCVIGTKRPVRQIPVAVDGVTFSYALNQDAARCIATLSGKGLTVHQLRWIYSSFTVAQLAATGWDQTSLPGSDGNDKTHLWSELGGSGCPTTEIAISGSPSTSGTYSFMTSILFQGVGETVPLSRPSSYYNVPSDDPDKVVAYLQQQSAAIGFFGFSYYSKNTNTLGAAPIKNLGGLYVAPTEVAFGDGSYNPFSRHVFMELSRSFLTFAKTSAFVKFGLSPIGDVLTQAAGLNPLSAATKASLVASKIFVLIIPCFSDRSTVQVKGQGLTFMKDLMIGDKVLNGNNKYDTVYSFGHYAPETQAEFLQIYATGMDQPLEISKEHMVFTDETAIPASAVKVGDKLDLAHIGGDGGVATVVSIKTVVRHGAFAPFTMSGTIAVNGFAASVYVDLQNDKGVLTVGGYKTPLSMQFMAHVFQSPHRLVCKVAIPLYCRSESYDENGVSTWVAGRLALAEWVTQQHVVLMTVVLVPCFLLSLFLFAVEVLLSSGCFLSLLSIVVGSLVLVRSDRKK